MNFFLTRGIKPHKGKILLNKSPLFRTLNANISRTANDKKVNVPILKSSHYGLSYEHSVKFLILSL